MASSPLSFAITVPIGPEPSEWLDWTLRSLKAQKTQTHIAICSVNEGDKLKSRLTPFKHMIAYERFGPDSGQSDAINEGWKAVKADIYSWLNDDDYLAPGALDKVAKIFANNPEIDVVFGDSLISEAGAIIGKHPGPRSLTDQLYRDNLISQPSCFIRRDALVKVGWVGENLHYTMDWDLWVRLYEKGYKFHYIPKTLSIVRHYADTKTGSITFERIKEIYTLVRRHNSVSLSFRSCASFVIAHLATYGPARALFKHIERLLRARTAKEGSSRTITLKTALFHYSDTSRQYLTLSFERRIQHQVFLGDEKAFEGKAESTSLEINLPSETLLNIAISSPEYDTSDTTMILSSTS